MGPNFRELNPAHQKHGGVQQNCKIHTETAIPNVVEVVVRILVNPRGSSGAELPKARHPRCDLQPLPMCRTMLIDKKPHLRSRANKGHLPFHYIQKLRQLIETASAQPASGSRDPRIGRTCGRYVRPEASTCIERNL